MSSDDVPSLGGYAVNTSGGVYDYVYYDEREANIIIGVWVVVFLLLFVHSCYGLYTWISNRFFESGYRNGFQTGFDKMGLANSGAGLRIIGAEPSDNLKVSGFTDAGDVTRDRWAARTGFVNHRDLLPKY